MSEHADKVSGITGAANELSDLIHDAFDRIDEDGAIDTWGVEELFSLYMRLCNIEKELRHILTRVYSTTQKFKNHRLVERMDNMGVDKIQVRSLGRSFYPMTRTTASMKDTEACIGWLIDNGAGALVTKTVNPRSLSAYLSELFVEQGVEAPADIFKVSLSRYISSRSYNPGPDPAGEAPRNDTGS